MIVVEFPFPLPDSGSEIPEPNLRLASKVQQAVQVIVREEVKCANDLVTLMMSLGVECGTIMGMNASMMPDGIEGALMRLMEMHPVMSRRMLEVAQKSAVLIAEETQVLAGEKQP